MTEQEICQDCYQKHDCKEAYRQMGENGGPSVVVSVVMAFLLPIVVFITSLAVFEEIFAGVINSKLTLMVLGLITSLIITFACILVVRIVNRRFSRDG